MKIANFNCRPEYRFINGETWECRIYEIVGPHGETSAGMLKAGMGKTKQEALSDACSLIVSCMHKYGALLSAQEQMEINKERGWSGPIY